MKILILHNDNFPCDTDFENWGNSFKISSGHISLYPYTWLFDPFLAAFLPESFTIHQLERIRQADIDDQTLLIIPHRDNRSDDDLIRKHILQNRKIILIDARPHQLNFHPDLKNIESEDRFLSNCESWTFGDQSGRWQYPQGISFEALYNLPAETEIFSQIGEWPDMAGYQNILWTATDAIHGFELYRQDYSELGADGFSGQFLKSFISAVRSLLDSPQSSDEIKLMDRYFELRRDFHALGFCYRTLCQGMRLEGKESKDDPVPGMIHRAARHFLRNPDETGTRRELAEIFQLVKSRLDALFPFKRYFIDGLHGGISYKNYGFAEYDYPEKSNNYIQMYLDWSDRFDYRFNLQVGMSTHEEVARRHPEFYQKLKSYCDQGKLEIVDGSYGQQYPHFFSIESNLRQLVYGQEVAQKLFNRKVRHHVRQEFGFTPQHPGLLKGTGFETALHRTQNWGAAPKETVPTVNWRGCDNSTIPAITSTPADDEHRPVDFFLRLADFFHQTKKHKISHGIYSNFLDLFWCPPFREDAIRAANYGAILGRFVTVGQLWAEIGKPNESRSYKLSDYQYTIFSQYGWGGTFYSSLNLSAKMENLLFTFESLLALSPVSEKVFKACKKQIDETWKILFAFQNHDSFCVPQTTAGGHTREYRGLQGPGRRYTAVEIGSKLATEAWQNLLARYIEFVNESMIENTEGKDNETNYVIYNTHLEHYHQSGTCKIIHYDESTGKLSESETEFCLNRMPASFQKIAKINAPEWNRIDTDIIENRFLKIKVDVVSGAIISIVDKAGRRNITGRDGIKLTYPNAEQTLISAGFFEVDGNYKAELKGYLVRSDAVPIAFYHTKILLECDSRRIDFVTRLYPNDSFFENPSDTEAPFSKMYFPPIDQWNSSIQVKADFADNWDRVQKIYLNILEEPAGEQFQSLNAAVISDNAKFLIFHNHGNQHYIRKDGQLSNILLHPREEQRTFRYALELIDSESRIFQQIAAFQHQPLIVPVNAKNSFKAQPINFQTQPENIVVTAIIPLECSSFLIRLAETIGRPTECELHFSKAIKKLFSSNHLGESLQEQAHTGDGAVISIDALEIKTIRIELDQ